MWLFAMNIACQGGGGVVYIESEKVHDWGGGRQMGTQLKTSSINVLQLNIQRQWKPRFFFSILWCSQSGSHSLADLAKCSYGLYVEVEKVRKFSFYVGYMLEIVVEIWWLKFFFLEIWELG